MDENKENIQNVSSFNVGTNLKKSFQGENLLAMNGIIENYDEVSSMRFSQINIPAPANSGGEVNVGSFANNTNGMNSFAGTINTDVYKRLAHQSPSAGTGVHGMNIDSILSNALRTSSKQGSGL